MSVRESDNVIHCNDAFKFAELIANLKDFGVSFTARVVNDPVDTYWVYIHNN